MLSEQYVQIALGERVVIVGAPGTGKTLLFRATAGLWPWGSGRVALPSTDGVMFVPRQPYVPLETLRAAVAYPSPETAFKDEEVAAVLQRAGLDRLSSSLDQIARWDKELSVEEQQCLVLTRVLLHKPRLVVIDEALDPLDDDARNRVLRLSLRTQLSSISAAPRPRATSLRAFCGQRSPGPVLPARFQSRLT